MKEWKEYKFRIEGYTPDTLPMARLAEYLRELAEILGETPRVHFVRLEQGSVSVVNKVESEAVPKVRERITAVKERKGTVTQMRAYQHINNMLREDETKGALDEDKIADVLIFPGAEEAKLQFTSIQQQGEMDGEVVRIGGRKDWVPIILDIDGKEVSGCHAKRGIAKELAKYLFEPVRLYGIGRWDRSPDGEWSLGYFAVNAFEPLEQRTLSETVVALRGLKGEWGKDSLKEILDSRNYEDEH
jgi:hypothetical protein